MPTKKTETKSKVLGKAKSKVLGKAKKADEVVEKSEVVENCESCKYLWESESVCRRLPPTIDSFPVVNVKWWCGEYVAK